MKWMPIETAPKDGTAVLVWDSEDFGYGTTGVLLVEWRGYRYHLPGEKEQFDWCIPGSDQDELGGCATAGKPTHWMPLPEPPKEGE